MTLAAIDPYIDERRRLADAQAVAQKIVSGDTGDTLYADIEDVLYDAVCELPAGVEDYDARRLLQFLVELRRALTAGHGAEARLAAARIADVARRLSRRLEHTAMEDPRVAADFVLEQLRTVGQADIGRLLRVTGRTVGSWQQGKPVRANGDRVVLVAQLLHYLRPSLTPRGVLAWFQNPSDRLGDRTPLEVLSEPDSIARALLLPFARGARAQLAD